MLLGLALLAVGAGTPDETRGLTHRSSVESAGAGAQGWFDLELPEGEVRRVQRAEVLGALLQIKDELDRAPLDARLDLDRQTIVAERPGRRLEVDVTLAAVERALAAGDARASVAFGAVPPRRLARELGGVAAGVALGSFETRSDRPLGQTAGDDALRRIARALDGTVLLPGEELSFNASVGPRDESRGYRVAAAAALGERIDGVGSSASRCASTLFAAALFAGLEVLERHPHRGARPVIELGLEAAVAFPSLDLRLKNPYDFPIVLRLVAAGARVRAEVRGARRPYVTTLVRKVDQVTAFARIERDAASLRLGERALAQRGVPGLELRWHHMRREGFHTVRKTVIERSPPTPEIVLVGTGSMPPATGRPQRALPAEPSPIRPLPRERVSPESLPAEPLPAEPLPPEPLLGELLVMTQGDEEDGAPTLQRVPGRYGTPGWSKNVGEPAWSSELRPEDQAAPDDSAAEFSDL